MHVTNLYYLEDGAPCFKKFPDNDTKKSNRILVRLDIAIVILETDDQDLLDQIDLEAKQVNKKNKKAERR